MIESILSFGTPGAAEWLIILMISLVPVVIIVWFIKYLLKKTRESQRLRLEVGKLADEVEQLRKK